MVIEYNNFRITGIALGFPPKILWEIVADIRREIYWKQMIFTGTARKIKNGSPAIYIYRYIQNKL